jgi:ribonuclease P protein component
VQVVSVSAVAPNASSKPSDSRRRHSFPRRVRLLKHADFERVYKLGRRHFAAHITVFYLARVEGDGFRVGFTVGRVLGGAVDRNRMKRRLREAVRLLLPERPAPVDVVINPKKSMLAIEFTELKKEVSRAFEVIQKFAEKRPPVLE